MNIATGLYQDLLTDRKPQSGADSNISGNAASDSPIAAAAAAGNIAVVASSSKDDAHSPNLTLSVDCERGFGDFIEPFHDTKVTTSTTDTSINKNSPAGK